MRNLGLGKFLVVVLCALVGGTLFGIEMTKRVESRKLEELPGIYIPENISKEMAPFDVINVVYNISMNPLRGLLGVLLGGLFGVFGVQFLARKIDFTRLKRRMEGFKKRNLLFAFCFLLLFTVIWATCVIIGIEIKEPLTALERRAMTSYLAVFSAVGAWVIVGRKIRLGPTIKKVLSWILLGPLNYIQVKSLNTKQKKVLWVGMMLVLFFFLFPPWIGFEAKSGDRGIGDADFVGFHFFLSTQYGVLYDAPYAIAQIYYSMQKALIISVLVPMILGFVYFRERVSTKKE